MMYARSHARPFIPPHLTAHIRTLSAVTSRSASPSPAPPARLSGSTPAAASRLGFATPPTRFASPAPAPRTAAARPAASLASSSIVPSQALGSARAPGEAVPFVQKDELWILQPRLPQPQQIATGATTTTTTSTEERIMYSCDQCKHRKIRCGVQAEPGQRAPEASGVCTTCAELGKQCTWKLALERIARNSQMAQKREVKRPTPKRSSATPTKRKSSISSDVRRKSSSCEGRKQSPMSPCEDVKPLTSC